MPKICNCYIDCSKEGADTVGISMGPIGMVTQASLGRTNMRQIGPKPPKLRFRPGTMMRLSRTRCEGDEVGQLYEILYAYRTQNDPSTWLFLLEEREPGGVIPAEHLQRARLCYALSNQGPDDVRIKWEPLSRKEEAEVGRHDYCHGDRATVTNKDLLQNFEKVLA